MYCLKCGKETNSEQIFCDHCLEVMESYPIKPGTPIQLPKRGAAAAGKKSSRRRLTMEEQIQRLRVTVRTLLLLLLAVSLLSSYFIWSYFQPRPVEEITPESAIGQNYTVEESTDKD